MMNQEPEVFVNLKNYYHQQFTDVLAVCSKYFREMQDICGKYKNKQKTQETIKDLSPPKRLTISKDPETKQIEPKEKKKIEESPREEKKKGKEKSKDPLKDDPNAPKKGITQPYLIYFTDVRLERQAQHQDLKSKELTKIIGQEKW